MLLDISKSEELPQPQVPVEPLCPYFGPCGGCAFQHFSYEEELALKHRLLSDLFSAEPILHVRNVQIEPVIPSPRQYHYRHRLDLSLGRFREEGIKIGYNQRTVKRMLEIDQCPIGMEAVSDFIPRLKEEVYAMIPDKYRMANLTVKTGDDGRVDWGGIGKGSLRRPEEEWFWTDIGDKRVYYGLDTFFQANLSILPAVQAVLQQLLERWPADLFLDLYGGVGLFTILAADHVGQAVLIEENPAAVQIAERNLERCGLDNLQLVAARVEDAMESQLHGRDLSRCVAMVDPPRKGLTPAARELLDQHLTRMFYLSCNPQALIGDLAWFTEQRGWKIHRVQPFDFFPQTPHLETLVVLERMGNSEFSGT